METSTHAAQHCIYNCFDLDVLKEKDQSFPVARPTMLSTIALVVFFAIQHSPVISNCSPAELNYRGLTWK